MRRKRQRITLNPLQWLSWAFLPISRNGAFMVFMLVLGWLCNELELMPFYLRNKGAEPYALALPELFFDLYIVCVVLCLLPRRLRQAVRALLYVILYGTALIDVFCYDHFQSTLTPTMLMLVGETNGREAGEFFSGYLSWDIFTQQTGWILLLMLCHLLWTQLRHWLGKLRQRLILPSLSDTVVLTMKALAGTATIVLVVIAACQSWDNQLAIRRLFSHSNLGQVEHELTLPDKAELFMPIQRLAFALHANKLASQQIDQLRKASEKIVVDSCVYRVPEIVLIIGESYNKRHSQLYGYPLPTTPRQQAMAEAGELVAYTDVVSPWNLTSFVFKHMLSMHAVGDEGEWCDEPLFPEVFRRAGYHVSFITNQFLPQAREAVYDFSGGFFLNNPVVSDSLFDSRNHKLHRYDEDVLSDWEAMKASRTAHNLTIFHLMGSHVDYRARYPQKTRRKFMPGNYSRPELTARQVQTLAHYDNTLLYNDSIVASITQRFTDRDAIVIYMPDHGEEIFERKPYIFGRMHAAEIDYPLAHNEMEIPFWIWGSPLYRERHPYGWLAIQQAKDKPLMIDILPHTLLYLAGIATPLYKKEYNFLLPDYNTHRQRILKGKTDYNTLKP
ncbi:MAG: phosphoethanolamine transferase [Prevotella sp.]|nr:phosphoethanolamine transferase [Prevotella sp.]